MLGKSHDQEQAEQTVEEEEARGGPFVVAVEMTLMAMLITDPTRPHAPIVFANDAFIEMSGHEREEVLGKSYHFLSGPDTNPDVARDNEIALRAGEAIVREVQLYRKDGKHLWVLQHAAAIFENGQIRHHSVSFLDITDRKAAEDELRQLNEELDRHVVSRTERLGGINRKLAEEVERRTEVERVLRTILQDKDTLLREKDHLMTEVNHPSKIPCNWPPRSSASRRVSKMPALYGRRCAAPWSAWTAWPRSTKRSTGRRVFRRSSSASIWECCVTIW